MGKAIMTHSRFTPPSPLYPSSLVVSTWPVFPIEQFIFFRPLAFPATRTYTLCTWCCTSFSKGVRAHAIVCVCVCVKTRSPLFACYENKFLISFFSFCCAVFLWRYFFEGVVDFVLLTIYTRGFSLPVWVEGTGGNEAFWRVNKINPPGRASINKCPLVNGVLAARFVALLYCRYSNIRSIY